MVDVTHEPDIGMRRCSCGGLPQRLPIKLEAKSIQLYGYICTKCGRRSQPAAYPTVAKENWNRMVSNNGISKQG